MREAYTPGELVQSRSGRDKGRALVVLGQEGEFVYVADGELRRLQRPKKKKAMHLRPYPKKDLPLMAFALDRPLCDADIRKHIAALMADNEPHSTD